MFVLAGTKAACVILPHSPKNGDRSQVPSSVFENHGRGIAVASKALQLSKPPSLQATSDAKMSRPEDSL
jgi:hypothetical protein